MIHKEGRDPLFCKNYRPISLVNVNYKVVAKLLALRLEPLMQHLIDKEQCGFVKGRLTSDNSRLFLNGQNKVSSLSCSLAAISIDAEKAFDRVDWSFLFKTLNLHGFSPKIFSLISLLYSVPRASVLVNGRTSNYFPPQCGVRQGCPLSPLLFILALEPFLSSIHNNDSISGFPYGDHHLKLSAYVDDILLFFPTPKYLFPHLLQEISSFSLVSGYKINSDKTEILPLTKFCPQHSFSSTGFFVEQF